MINSRRVLLVVGFSSFVFSSCVKKGGEIRVDVSKNSVELSWGPKEAQPCPTGFIKNQNGDCVQTVPSGPVNVSISGKVYSTSSKLPISGARIGTSLDSQFSQTDPSGFFFLNTNTKGQGNYSNKPYAITISADGYKSFSQSNVWGDNPSNQVFYMVPDELFYYISQLAAPIVDREYKNYLLKGPKTVPDLITGQGSRMQELQKAFNQERASLMAYDRDQREKFGQEKEKAKNDLENSISKKSDTEQAKIRREFNSLWQGKYSADIKRAQEEQCYLNRRQTLEKDEMNTLFAEEKIASDSPDVDQSQQIESSWASYQAKHSSPEYLLASCKQEPEPVEGSLKVSINPRDIKEGQSAELSWECWYCGKEATILPEPGNVIGHRLITSPPPELKRGSFPLIGFGSSVKISPKETTQYKVIAKNWFGKALERSAEVTVSAPPPLPQTFVKDFRWVEFKNDDRVGKSKTAVNPDGQPDGEFDLTVEGPFDNLMIETARPGETGAQSSQKDVQVTANPLWTDTGLTVVKGQKVDVTAQGSWSWGALVGPNGGSECCAWDAFQAFDSNDKGRLLAYIGSDPLQGNWGNGSFFPRKQGYISVGSKQTFYAPESGKLWLGFNDDAVSKAVGDNSGIVKANVVLYGSEEIKPVPCCGQVWNTIPKGPVTAAGAQWDASQIWVLGAVKLKEGESYNSKLPLMNRPDGSIPTSAGGQAAFRLFAANSGYFHKGQNFILSVIRPDGQVVRAYAQIESEPEVVISTPPVKGPSECPAGQVNHDPVRVRDFSIRTECGKGEASYIANTSFSPSSLQANQGDTIHLSVFGPPYKEGNDFCYSVSFAIPAYGVYIPKIVRGTKQEATFVADKFGEFSYVDQERRHYPYDPRGPKDIRPLETRPGTLYICQNEPPALTGMINFDSVDASRQEVDAAHYLAGYGIALGGISKGTRVVIVNSMNSYGGKAARPPSPPNWLTQIGSNDPVSFSLNFSKPIVNLGFTRPMLLAGPSGITHPEWIAHALDEQGKEVAAVSEPQIASYSDVPAKLFFLDGRGANIKSVRFDSNNRHFCAFSSVLIDDLYPDVPRPAVNNNFKTELTTRPAKAGE